MKSGKDKNGAVWAVPVVGALYPKRCGEDYMFKAGVVIAPLGVLDDQYGVECGLLQNAVYVEALNAEVVSEGDPRTAVGATVEVTRMLRVAPCLFLAPGTRGVVLSEREKADGKARALDIRFAECGVVTVRIDLDEPITLRRLWGTPAVVDAPAESSSSAAPADEEEVEAVW